MRLERTQADAINARVRRKALAAAQHFAHDRPELWLLGGGIALAVAARLASTALLYPAGGLDRLLAQGEVEAEDASAATTLLWAPEQGTSWWYLALASPHSHTQLDLAHTLGSAVAVLGACLLLTRIPTIGRLLGPIEAAGTMTLTLYTAHILILETGALEDDMAVQYVFVVVVCLAFALVWRRWRRQGPLERLVAAASGRARRQVLAADPPSSGARRTVRRRP
jgi:uncharacterized membrane protein YeiB